MVPRLARWCQMQIRAVAVPQQYRRRHQFNRPTPARRLVAHAYWVLRCLWAPRVLALPRKAIFPDRRSCAHPRPLASPRPGRAPSEFLFLRETLATVHPPWERFGDKRISGANPCFTLARRPQEKKPNRGRRAPWHARKLKSRAVRVAAPGPSSALVQQEFPHAGLAVDHNGSLSLRRVADSADA